MDELFIITFCINLTRTMHIKIVQKIKTNFLCTKLVSENRAFY